jgi:predicted nucleic acid-binding protein
VAGEDSLQKPKVNFILDTGIILRYFWEIRQAAELLEFLQQIGTINVSAITYMEVLTGIKPEEEEITKIFFERIPPLIVSEKIAEKSAFLIRKYQSVFGRNNPRRYPDAIIAATAWQQQGMFFTLDNKHFGKTKIDEFIVKVIEQEKTNWISQLNL